MKKYLLFLTLMFSASSMAESGSMGCEDKISQLINGVYVGLDKQRSAAIRHGFTDNNNPISYISTISDKHKTLSGKVSAKWLLISYINGLGSSIEYVANTTADNDITLKNYKATAILLNNLVQDIEGMKCGK